MKTGTIYTETVIYSAPEAFAKDVPYQTAIVSLEGGGRVTGRISGDRVEIGDRVTEIANPDPPGSLTMSVPFFQKA